MRYLRVHDLPLPVRPLLGPAPHEVVWREANSARVRSILQNPAYAGAYVYGRRRPDPVRRRSGRVAATTKVPLARGRSVCQRPFPATFPGRSSWPTRGAWRTTSTATQPASTASRAEAMPCCRGLPTCGRCGRRMSLRYTGPKGDYPVYCCRADRDQGAAPLCQEVRALPVDAFVARTCSRPWRRTGSRSPSRRSGSCRRKRASSTSSGASARACPLRSRAGAAPIRCGRAGEPPGGAIPGAGLGGEAARCRGDRAGVRTMAPREPLVLSEADHAALQTLGEDLPRVWRATTTAADRKRLLRFIIKEVALDQKRERGQVWLKILGRPARPASMAPATVSDLPRPLRSRAAASGGWWPSTPPARWTRRSRRC